MKDIDDALMFQVRLDFILFYDEADRRLYFGASNFAQPSSFSIRRGHGTLELVYFGVVHGFGWMNSS